MACEKILLEYENKANANRDLKALFDCLYENYHDSMTDSLVKTYQNKVSIDRYKLREVAEDAFHDGLTSFYLKFIDGAYEITSKEEDFFAKIIYTFCDFGMKNLLYKGKMFIKMIPFEWYLKSSGVKNFESSEIPFIDMSLIQFDNITIQCLIRIINMLPQNHRDLIVMTFFYKLSSKEIASKMDAYKGDDSVNTARGRAYKKLFKLYQENCKILNL